MVLQHCLAAVAALLDWVDDRASLLGVELTHQLG